jgi:hypothetical protein
LSGAGVMLIVAAVLAGIFLLGLYGDIAIGWVVFGVATVLETAVLVTVQLVRRLNSPLRQSPGLGGTRAARTAGRLPQARGR